MPALRPGQRMPTPNMQARSDVRELLPMRKQALWLHWRVGHFMIASERRSRNPVPLHLVDQRSALQTELGGCAIPSSDYPTGCFKRTQNQSALGIYKGSWSRAEADLLRSGGQQRVRKYAIFGQDYCTLDQILQLADVPGPVIRTEGQHRFWRNLVDLPAYPSPKNLDKVRNEGRNVFTALSQGRQHDREYIEAKIEVTAKFAISHHSH